MAKHRGLRKLPKLDMNPMVDMAFLLVTFFMMTTTFKEEVPAEVTIPYSTAELKVPEKDLCTITIDQEGTVYLGIDNKYDRRQLLGFVATQNGLQFNQDQVERFSLISSFGVPLKDLSAFLSLQKSDRRGFEQDGIPIDSAGNELKYWLVGARMANPNLRFAINGDGDAAVYDVKRVFDILQDLNITRFNLITDAKRDDS